VPVEVPVEMKNHVGGIARSQRKKWKSG